MDIASKIKLITELFPDGRFDTYFARSLGRKTSLHEIKELWTAHAARIRSGAAPPHMMLYSHTPYCLTRCTYCIYDSDVVGTRAEMGAHLYRMSRECAALGPALDGLPFNCMLAGGGTPGVQTDRNFDLTLKILNESFTYRPGCIKSVEMTPATTTPRKAAIMARHGINRVSIGVQSTTPRVLELVNRGSQTMQQIRDAIVALRAEGIAEITVDLIAGLPAETEETFIRTIEQITSCRPDTIVLYLFQQPGGECADLPRSELADRSWDDLTALFFDKAASCGFAKQDRRHDFSAVWAEGGASKWLAVNDLQSEIGSDIIGLGAQSFTNVFGEANYFNHGPAVKTDPQAPDVYQLQPVTMDIEAGTCIRRFIEFNRPLPRAEFAKYFGQDPASRFPAEFAHLAEQQLIEIAPAEIRWRFTGKAQASLYSALFFDEHLLKTFHEKERATRA